MSSSWKWMLAAIFGIPLALTLLIGAIWGPRWRENREARCQDLLHAAESRADTLLALQVSDCEARARRMKGK